MQVRWWLIWAAAILLGWTGLAAGESTGPQALQDVYLKLFPPDVDDEASGLLPIQNRAFLKEGWELGFWVVLDEPPVEQAIARLGRRADRRGTNQGWEVVLAPARLANPYTGRTGDCEAITRRDDMVYIFGSHFGKKKGPLEDQRHFLARFADPITAVSRSSPEPHLQPELKLDVAFDHFLLHRVINDAFKERKLDLIERGPAEYKKYIRKTLKEEPFATGLVHEDDRAINIEGAAFLDSGLLLLGLRYPVTRLGHPILIVIGGIDRLFTGGRPQVESLWVLNNIGDADRPAGIRDLFRRNSRIEALTGNLDRFSNIKGESIILADHPEGNQASSRHCWFSWPPPAGAERDLQATLTRDLAPRRNAEGLAADPGGRFYYVFDEHRLRLQYETEDRQ